MSSKALDTIKSEFDDELDQLHGSSAGGSVLTDLFASILSVGDVQRNTLSGTYTVADNPGVVQSLDPDGSTRTVVLPTPVPTDEHNMIVVINKAGGANALDVEKNGSPNLPINSISQGSVGIYIWDGVEYAGFTVSATIA
jgi:hypothetical protein